MPTTRDELAKALEGVEAPKNPVDGDCLKLAPQVTNKLVDEGFPAELVTVVGWAGHTNKIIAFAHQATACDGWIIDFTARQFNPWIDRAVFSLVGNYATELASMAGVQMVTVHTGREQLTPPL